MRRGSGWLLGAVAGGKRAVCGRRYLPGCFTLLREQEHIGVPPEVRHLKFIKPVPWPGTAVTLLYLPEMSSSPAVD